MTNSQNLTAIISEKAVQTLEQLAFLFPYTDDTREELSAGAASWGRVAFEGPFRGRLLMVLSNGTLRELAGNMLAMDADDVSEEECRDAMKEALNIICGNSLPEIAGREAIFAIGAPEIAPGKTSFEKPENPDAVVKLSFDNGQCHLFFSIDKDVAGQ